jgi:hypothetical protein
MADLQEQQYVCAVCQHKKEKSPKEFDLVCFCPAKHGVCRACYTRHGPPPPPGPVPRAADYEEIQRYAWKTLGGMDCAAAVRCTLDEDEGEGFTEVAALIDVGFETLRRLRKKTRAVDEKIRHRQARDAFLCGRLFPAIAFFIFVLMTILFYNYFL